MAMKMKGLSRKQSIYGFCFALPGLIGFTLFVLVPLAFTMYYSFTNGVGDFTGVSNYIDLLKSQAFILAMRNTALYLIFGGGLGFLIAFALAWVLYALAGKGSKVSSNIRVTYLLSMIVPTGVSVIFAEILFSSDGVISSFFSEPINLLTTSPYTFWILVVIYIWKNFGYFVIIFLAAFSQIRKEVFEAARLDGATGVKLMWKIVIPQVKPTMFFVFIMSIIGVFKMSRESFLLFGNYPSESAYILQNFIDNNLLKLEINRAATSAMFLFIFFSVIIYFLIIMTERSDDI